MGLRSEDPKLIIRVLNFELVQPICSRYVNVTERQTDGQLTIAIPCFALRASRGKNTYECFGDVENILVKVKPINGRSFPVNPVFRSYVVAAK